MATPRAAPVSPATSRPPISIVPAVGSSSPAIMRSMVDLPQPEGPRRTVRSPCSTEKETSATAVVASKLLVTERTFTLCTASPHRPGRP